MDMFRGSQGVSLANPLGTDMQAHPGNSLESTIEVGGSGSILVTIPDLFVGRLMVKHFIQNGNLLDATAIESNGTTGNRITSADILGPGGWSSKELSDAPAADTFAIAFFDCKVPSAPNSNQIKINFTSDGAAYTGFATLITQISPDFDAW